MGRGYLPLSHTDTPTKIFQNDLCVVRWHKQTSLQSSRCLVCRLSIFDNALVGSCLSVTILLPLPLPLSKGYHADYTVIFKELYNNDSSSGVNLTPYSGVIFWGVILTPKRSLKNSFSGVKVTPDIEELK